MAAAANTPDLIAVREGLRRLQIYLLEKTANAQACGQTVVLIPVAEVAEYAKAITNALVGMATPPAPPAESQSPINAALQKMVKEVSERVQPSAASTTAGNAVPGAT